MTSTNIRLCTTHELEYVINNFTYYDPRYLKPIKRELDRRHRIKLIKRQFDQIINKHDFSRNN